MKRSRRGADAKHGRSENGKTRAVSKNLVLVFCFIKLSTHVLHISERKSKRKTRQTKPEEEQQNGDIEMSELSNGKDKDRHNEKAKE